MKFWAAWQFLTIIPSPRNRGPSLEEIGRSQGFFPLVGLILGFILFGLDLLASKIFPSGLVTAFIVVGLVILTGGIHLEGFADLCDGIRGGSSPQEKLRIMSDIRVGGFGVVGVSCLLLLKYFSLVHVPEALRMEALILMPTLSRWAMVCSIFSFPAAKSTGLGKAVKDKASLPNLALATGNSIAAVLTLMKLEGLMLLGALWLITMGFGKFLCLKFGGFTGDIYGAINEIIEVLSLILIILFSGF